MRKTVLLVAIAWFLSISSSHGATLVESKDDQGMVMKMWLDGSVMRIDIGNEPTYMLFDVKKKKMYAVDPAKREAMDMSNLFNEDNRNTTGQPAHTIQFEKQGKGPVIAGYDTVHYQATVNGMKCSDEYLSKKAFNDIGSLEIFEALSTMAESASMGMDMGMETPDPCESVQANAMEIYEKHGYPLKMVENDGSIDSEVIKISLKVAKPQKDFQVPDGYQIIDLGQMMNEQMKYMPQGGNPRGMPQMNGRDSQEMDPAEMQRMLEQMMKDMKQK